MSPNPAGKKWVTAHSKISCVSGGSVRNAVWVSSQCDPTIAVICMRPSVSRADDWEQGTRRKCGASHRIKHVAAASPRSTMTDRFGFNFFCARGIDDQAIIVKEFFAGADVA